MKQPNMNALAAAATLAGAVFFGSPLASAQQPPPLPAGQPAATPPATPPAAPAAPATPEAGAQPPPSVVKPAAPPPPVQRKITTPIIVAGAIGIAGLGSGVVFGILASSSSSSYKQKPDHQVGLDGERSAFIADVSFGVAALFGLTAIAMYILPDEPTPTGPAAATTSPTKTSWIRAALKGEVLSF